MNRRKFIFGSFGILLSNLVFAQSHFLVRDRLFNRDDRWRENERRGHSEFKYGAHELQSLDTYWPHNMPKTSPILFMVHGGAWRFGDKSNPKVVENKISYCHKKEWGFVSTNYRMLPEFPVEKQIEDVILAIRFVQNRYPNNPLILMGHSAGAHIIASIASRLPGTVGLKPWACAVFLDSAALDVISLMKMPHFPLYDDAFGQSEDRWKKLSPYHLMETGIQPILSIYSTLREESKSQSQQFLEKAKIVQNPVFIQGFDMKHSEINEALGENPGFDAIVDSFFKKINL